MPHPEPIQSGSQDLPAAVISGAPFGDAHPTPELDTASREYAQTIEQMWNVSRLNQDAIRFADTKAAAVFTANFAMAALIAGLSSTPHPIFSAKIRLTEFLLTSGGLTLAISAAFCLYAFYPKLKSTEVKSLLYFEDIVRAHSGHSDFHSKASKAYSSQEQLHLHLSSQVWVTSQILVDKFRSVQWAIRFMIPAALIMLIAIVASNWPVATSKKDVPCQSTSRAVSSLSYSPTSTAPPSSFET